MLAIPYLDPAAGGEARIIDTGSLVDCSGNYGISPDSRLLAVSCEQGQGAPHQVYVLPASGSGTPLQVTHGAQSFFHAWSPDSKSIAFTRGSASKADIFTVSAAGGESRQLTHDTINDGPDYSADGKFIYFDSRAAASFRSGACSAMAALPNRSQMMSTAIHHRICLPTARAWRFSHNRLEPVTPSGRRHQSCDAQRRSGTHADAAAGQPR